MNPLPTPRNENREMIAASRQAVMESKALLDRVRGLTSHITERLEKKSFCIVFENELRDVFPEAREERSKRHQKIADYAAENGWTVKISDPGIRAVFKDAVPK
jgi:hypothetical protein